MADLISDLSSLTADDIERIERLTMRWLFQAVVDFGIEPVTIFRNSPDAVKDVAEDVTRGSTGFLAITFSNGSLVTWTTKEPAI